MTVRLTGDTLTEMGKMCKWCRNRQSLSIQDLASLIGKLVASFPAVRYGLLHYRDLDRENVRALKQHRGDFQGSVVLGLRPNVSWPGGLST